MTDQYKQPPGTLPRNLLIALILLASGLMLAHLAGFASGYWAAALLLVVTEGGMAALIVIAAGGYAFPVVRRLSPPSAPPGLRAVTACGLGLWMLSSAMLVVGSVGGLLGNWLWWIVIAAGVMLAAWQGRKTLEAWRPPARYDGRSLLWVVVALAAGLWLAGAARAPGRIGVADPYDELEYHLQVPREYYNCGQIHELRHNCYSYYPLGMEMLFLTGMCLRGGAYEGMYLAKMLHGVFWCLAVGGVFLSLRRDDETRGRFAAGLLATVPMMLYLSFMALAELPGVCYLAIALLWLREYLRDSTWKAALCIGLMLGASCAFKYLSVGLVAAPVLLVMTGASLLKARKLAHLPLVAFATLLLFSPWLVRNTIYTGNPVFPLATDIFGKGHWSDESNKRWVDGHAPDPRPPVPQPADWKMTPKPDRPEMFFYNFLTSQLFGPMLLIIAAVAVATMIAHAKRPDPWDICLLATALLQLAAWTAFTPGMPPRFVVPVMVPITLLAGGVLARLAQVQVNPLKRDSVRPAHGAWGLVPAAVIFAATAGVNLFVGHEIFRVATRGIPEPPLPENRIARELPPYNHAAELPQGSRLLLVGEVPAFYFPANTVYATAFDTHLLAELIDRGLSARQIHSELRRSGITHIWVNWWEILRLATTYGYPEPLSREALRRWTSEPRQEPEIPILADMKDIGLITVLEHVRRSERDAQTPTSGPATHPASQPATQPAEQLADWPIVTIYVLATDASHADATGGAEGSSRRAGAHSLPAAKGIR
jgi:hypothetical protein